MESAPWRVVPLAGLLAFLGVLVWRAWLQHRRHGSPGVILFAGSPGQKIRDTLFVLLVLVLLGQAVAAAASPLGFAALSGAVPAPLRPASRVAGTVLLFGGLALMVRAQLDLGASFRIGIDERARPGLVTSGLFRLCRNPIFVSMLAVFLGFTLLLPNGVSILLLVGLGIGIRRQVLAEETYLVRTYGDDYRAYARRVGRFVPGVGRLA